MTNIAVKAALEHCKVETGIDFVGRSYLQNPDAHNELLFKDGYKTIGLDTKTCQIFGPYSLYPERAYDALDDKGLIHISLPPTAKLSAVQSAVNNVSNAVENVLHTGGTAITQLSRVVSELKTDPWKTIATPTESLINSAQKNFGNLFGGLAPSASKPESKVDAQQQQNRWEDLAARLSGPEPFVVSTAAHQPQVKVRRNAQAFMLAEGKPTQPTQKPKSDETRINSKKIQLDKSRFRPTMESSPHLTSNPQQVIIIERRKGVDSDGFPNGYLGENDPYGY